MQYIFVALTFLLVIEANFLSGSQWSKEKRPKRGFTLDETGHPIWASQKYNAIHINDRPIWRAEDNYYELDKSGRPIWKIEETIPKTTTPPTTTPPTTTTTTTKRSYYRLDKSGHPIWPIEETTPYLWDEKPPTTTEKSTTTTTNFITEEHRRLMHAQSGYNATSSNKEENPCETEPPPKRTNFSAPGKRRALEKCDEYKEEEKYKLQMRKNEADCLAYRVAHNLTNVGVINGLPTEQGEYPHMAALGWLTINDVYDFQCGGILISSNFVLTAAHCTYARSTNYADFTPKIVRLGDNNIGDEGKPHEHRIDVPISDIIKHKEYKTPIKYNDIALLKLEEDVFFNADVRPACLWHQFDTTSLSTKANVSGWGKISSMSDERSSKLLYGELNIVTNKICKESLDALLSTRGFPNGVEDSIQICAGIPTGGVDSCQGDSGGPLQILKKEEELSVYYVIGVTSNGMSCAVPGIPGIYTRVSPYLDWIESCVWDDINSSTCLKYSERML